MGKGNIGMRVFSPSNRGKLALLAGATAQPFADVFWETAKDDEKVTLGVLNLLSRLQAEKQYGQVFEILRILHSAFHVRFGPELLNLQRDPVSLAYFLDCFLQDFYEIIDDHVAGIG